MIVFVSGLPGTGKTYFAKALSRRLGGEHFNTDGTRKAMDMMGQYDEQDREQVYQELQRRMEKALRHGSDVVVDATFIKRSRREAFETAARRWTDQVFWVRMTASEEVIRKRVSKDRPDSEADLAVYEKLKAAEEPLQQDHMTLDSGEADAEALVDQVLLQLEKARSL